MTISKSSLFEQLRQVVGYADALEAVADRLNSQIEWALDAAPRSNPSDDVLVALVAAGVMVDEIVDRTAEVIRKLQAFTPADEPAPAAESAVPNSRRSLTRATASLARRGRRHSSVSRTAPWLTPTHLRSPSRALCGDSRRCSTRFETWSDKGKGDPLSSTTPR